MVQVIQVSDLSLHEVKERFQLQQSWDDRFFPEWQQTLPDLADREQLRLDQIKADFLSLVEFPLHEEVIKLFVLAPILSMAGLARFPFVPVAEKQVEIELEDGEKTIRGRIDLLILHRQLWGVVIESKAHQFSVMKALPQALFYMMSDTVVEQPIFGLLTNGSEFIVVKLLQQSCLYGLSELFTLFRRENELYKVLQVLKHLRAVAISQRGSSANAAQSSAD